MLEWKDLSLECDSLQNKMRGDGPRVTDSSPPHFPHVSRLNGSVSGSVTRAFWATGFVFTRHGDRRATKITPIPSQAFSLSGRNRSVGSHTLFVCGSFKWCPETHISCLLESAYVMGEAVTQQFAFTPVIYLFSYMSACSSLSRNSLRCPKMTSIWGCQKEICISCL